MKGLVSTAASRAWVGVAAIGFVVAVLALALGPRLGDGQRLLDRAEPAFADERVAGTRAGTAFVAGYVDVLDPLVTPRSRAGSDARALVRLVARRARTSNAGARALLRREAPHVEALTRAAPLTAIADAELPRLIAFLAATLTLTEDDLRAVLEQEFPRIEQTLRALLDVTGGWRDVPGIEGLERFDGTPVRSAPQLRDYLRADLVPALVERRADVQTAAGGASVKPLGTILLLGGIALLAFGLLNAWLSKSAPSGRIAWGTVVGIGTVLVVLVVVLQALPRASAAQAAVDGLDPVFAAPRVEGLRNGVDTLHGAIQFGDPIMTRGGGAAAELPRLLRFVSQRTGLTSAQLRRSLEARTPRTLALLDALPLSSVGREMPRLVGDLARRSGRSGRRIEAEIARAAPRLSRTLLGLGDVSVGWNMLPGMGAMTRFDGTPVRTTAVFDDYLREDLAPTIVAGRPEFDAFSGGVPPIGALAPLLLCIGLLTALYGGTMLVLVSSPR